MTRGRDAGTKTWRGVVLTYQNPIGILLRGP